MDGLMLREGTEQRNSVPLITGQVRLLEYQSKLFKMNEDCSQDFLMWSSS